MDAIVLAAGLGTRLGEIGRDTPKALIEVGGKTMLEHVVGRLVDAGADRIVVNVHHHAARIVEFIRARDFGAEMLVSIEVERPLETGGALLHAKPLFRAESPIIAHNVDVLVAADLRGMHTLAQSTDALAVLAVNVRPTSRHLLFDEAGLFGRSDARDGTRIEARPPQGETRAFAFAGIHVITPDLLDRLTETGVFSILDPYLRMAAEGARILPFPLGDARWLEIGSPERLEAARAALAGVSAADG